MFADFFFSSTLDRFTGLTDHWLSALPMRVNKIKRCCLTLIFKTGNGRNTALSHMFLYHLFNPILLHLNSELKRQREKIDRLVKTIAEFVLTGQRIYAHRKFPKYFTRSLLYPLSSLTMVVGRKFESMTDNSSWRSQPPESSHTRRSERCL